MKWNEWFKTWRVFGSTLMAEVFGGQIFNGPVVSPLSTLTYNAGVISAPDLSRGNDFTVTATTNAAESIGAPTNPPPTGQSMLWSLTIRNTAGVALGALTFNAIYKLGAAWTQPATGFSRTIFFRWDGTNHVEVGRTAADVAN